ncbi:hypothetical protein ACFVMC_01735 [Nocardia sp. NPDC127579]|uniref:hypothetical protein n=1 Tax=Nocardia sp. NPDC127579 TaxID=3345402 RepID=UPI00362F3AEE
MKQIVLTSALAAAIAGSFAAAGTASAEPFHQDAKFGSITACEQYLIRHNKSLSVLTCVQKGAVVVIRFKSTQAEPVV